MELTGQDQFIPTEGYLGKIILKEVKSDFFLNFSLFVGVGVLWHWYSRLTWKIGEWYHYFNKGNLKTFLGFVDEKLVGYFELEFQEEGNVELAFIGLFPDYLGIGYGGFLLSHAMDVAFLSGARRIWLHTCDKDHPAAIDNYLARGFRIYREVRGEEEVPGREELLVMIMDLIRQYYDKHYDLKKI